jgi:hypothetical protein
MAEVDVDSGGKRQYLLRATRESVAEARNEDGTTLKR